jgi:hypothetical protein
MRYSSKQAAEAIQELDELGDVEVESEEELGCDGIVLVE